MLYMLKEFYEYISKRIIQFFEENDDNILNGARYCFTLNSQEAVNDLESVFYEYAETRTQVGIWDYTPPNSTSATYQTFTLDFKK